MSIVELQRPTPHSSKQFWADVPFVHSEVKDSSGKPTGALELRGYASTWMKDRDEEWIDPAAFDRSLESYLRKNPIILWQHQMDQAIGTMQSAFLDEFGLNVIADIPKPTPEEGAWKMHAYHSIRRGIVKTFSIGGIFQRDFVMGREVIKEIELLETSVVSIPSNPDSIFEAAVKALSGESSRPKLHPGHIKQMRQLIGIEGISDPELMLMSAAEKIERYKLLAQAYTKAGVRAPELDEWLKLKPRIMDATGKAVIGPATELAAVMKKANAGMAIEEKRGRTVSAKNEEKLRAALEVLGTAESKIDDWAAEAKSVVADAKAEIDVVLKQVSGEEEEETPAGETAEGEASADGVGDAVRRASEQNETD